MLILSRRSGQKICFPELGISIEVLASSGTVTKLGITAPQDIEVRRAEVQDRKHACVNDLSEQGDSGSECRVDRELKNKNLELRSQLLSRKTA